jgi:hypothetical protein
MSKEQRRKKLIQLLKNISPEMKRLLAKYKRDNKDIKRPDFIWYAILCSVATLGNERGYDGLIRNQSNYDRVTFDAISKIPSSKRTAHIEEVLRDAKVRMPVQKAYWIFENHGIILDFGGLEKVNAMALEQKGKDAKIRFLKQFVGIGDKYARVIWMDSFHEELRDSIAIDLRINQITAALGYEFTSYEEHERFYQEIAREAGLLTWEVDRLLYNYKDYFLKELKAGFEINKTIE